MTSTHHPMDVIHTRSALVAINWNAWSRLIGMTGPHRRNAQAVHDFAQNEFAEIMKGPAAIVQGDEQQVAEIQARMSAHVCELMSGYTPLMDELPPFVTPYLTDRSCGAH